MGKSFAPYQRNWKWFENNAAEPTAQLADQNVKPTLADSAIIRLRVNVAETGDFLGNGLVSIEYSPADEASWAAFGSGNHWNYADGAATAGNTISGYLTTGPNTLGYYHESGTLD